MNSRSYRASALRPTLLYLLLGVVWILASDQVLAGLVQDQALLTELQTLKGWAFVVLSAAVIYSLVMREIGRLQRAESRFQVLVEHALAGVCVVQHGRLAYVNPKFAEIFGASVAELLKVEDFCDLVVEEHRRLFGSLLTSPPAPTSDSPSPSASDTRIVRVVRRDDAESSIEVAAQPIEWRGAPAVIAMVLDRSEEERLEEQLRHAQRMEAMGRLTGSIAHDFNNLLTAAGVPLELALADLEADHTAREEVAEAWRAIASATRLTQQLLTFSRRRVTHPKRVDLAAAARDMSGMLGRLLGKDVELVVEACEPAGTVLIDPSHLEQVLVNLVMNACEAMPEGGKVVLRTSLAPPDPEVLRHRDGLTPGAHAILEVVDAGEGIDEALQSRIFEPFFTTKEKGTGLGLSTVFGIVRQAGGFVRVQSQVGRGTAMQVYLPMEAPPAPAESRPEPPPPAARPLSIERDRTILVVEDDDAVRRVFGRVLSGAGFRVLEVGDPLEALELARRADQEIDMMITDITLPGMSGVTLGTEFQRHRPDAAVLYASGYSGHEIVQQRADASLPFLEKPFLATELLERVSTLLATASEGGR